ncbi:MAG: plasmid pRiA4b ORF-3 family protein [Bacteroidia bacterium]|nr:plasmid pRiA4b ORF-3 family protein [Bacteroidia bacterium]
MTKKVYQLKMTLVGSKPKIWRQIIVNPDTLLVDLHRIIQTTMGWSNSHLHQFNDRTYVYAPKEFELEHSKNSRTIKLNPLLKKEKERIIYEYDFGDGWEHEIILEKILEDDEKNQIPRCIGGKRNCPPEDCGGIWGYEDLLKIISDKKHEDYKEMTEWLGEKFDPEYFNLTATNKLLKKKDFGCIWL